MSNKTLERKCIAEIRERTARIDAETEEIRKANKKRLIKIVENNFEEANSLISRAQNLDDRTFSDSIIKFCGQHIAIPYTLAQFYLTDSELDSYKEKYDRIKKRIDSYYEYRNQEA